MSLLLLTAKKKFSPYNWFKNGEQGAWYDPSDLTTLFQDSAGTTPVTLSPMEQPVGLMLDKSKGLALGAELKQTGVIGLVGTLATPATYNTTTGEGSINRVSYPGEQSYVSFSGLVPNSWYKFNFTALSGVSLNIRQGSAAGGGNPNQTAIPGLFYCQTDATGILAITCQSNGSSTFTLASIKQIAGNHAFQSDATPGKRPLLSARVNLLTKTEDFSTTPWVKGGGGLASVVTNVSGTNPLGATTLISKIDLPAVSGVGAFSQIYTSASVLLTENTVSMYLKGAVGGEIVYMMLTTDAVNWSSVPCTLTTSWQKFTVSRTPPASGTMYYQFGVDLRDPAQSAKPAQSFYAWGADLRPTNSGALLPPYQRVNTATDYDTVGFPLYLKCNGSSSAMSTNIIDYTTTNVTKLVIVSGFRSQVGGSICVFESSNNTGINIGAYNFGQGTVTGNTGMGFLGNGPTTSYGAETAPLTVPYINVSSLLLDEQATSLANRGKVRINSVDQALPNQFGSVSSSGSIANYPLYLFARNQSQYFLNGHFYGAIIRGAQSDTNSVVQTENYMAKQTGITF